MITDLLVAIAGIAVLLWIALLIGASMDTEAQRREWRRVAHERRIRWEDRQATVPRRPRRADGLCADCPLRE